MDETLSFGYWVRRRRKALDLTQQDLAKQINCSDVTIRKIESDVRRPSLQIANLLADCLRIAPEERARFLQCARGERRIDQIDIAYDVFESRPACPYPGMVPFRAEDARCFYGREDEIQHLLRLLRYHRLLFVIGPSGSGKSSLVFAGLLPRLLTTNLFRPDSWLVRTMRPGSRPMEALVQILEGDPVEPAPAVAALIHAHQSAERLLLVIDQFEEAFALAEHSEQARFIAALHALQALPACTLLLTLRADFYADLMNSDLWPLPAKQRLEIAPLRGAALRQAIQQPAADCGVQLEAGLLERLLADAADEPGVLPLVQETMVLLWDSMEECCLPLRAYERLGGDERSGLAVALADKADATLGELSLEHQAIARRIFVRLVQFGEGRADTRRQQPVAALCSDDDDPSRFAETLCHLVDNRLLTLSGGEEERDRKVDIAHEALLSGWPTLRTWLIERREAEQIRRRLEAKALEWRRLGSGDSGLLSTAELIEAERWIESPDAADLGVDTTLRALMCISRTALAEAEHERAARAAAEAEQRQQRALLQQRAQMLNEVLNIFRALSADQPLEVLLEQIARSANEAIGFRSVVFNIIDPDDPTMLLMIAGVGLSLTEFDQLRRGQFPRTLIQRFFEPRFQIGRCFFIPATAMREIAFGIDTTTCSSDTADEWTSDKWQTEDRLFIPLYSTSAELIGLMAVHDPLDRQRPTHHLVETLEIFADQAAIAIENAALLQKARNQAEQMTALYRASAATVSTLDLDDLLERVYREIVAYMGTPSQFSITTYDPQSDRLFFELHRRGDGIASAYHKTFQPKAGFTGWVIDTNELLQIRNWPAEQEQVPVVPLVSEVRSWVGIPLRSQSRTIGVLSVHSLQPYAFGDRVVQFLSTLANQLAVALENAQLFRERERRIAELDLINLIGRITSSTLDVEHILGQIYDCLGEFLTVDAFFGCVYDGDRNEVSIIMSVDEGQRRVEQYSAPPTPGSCMEWLLNHRQPLLFNDMRTEAKQRGFKIIPYGNLEHVPAAWLGVPLLVGEDEVVGALSVQSDTPGRYGERELAFMTTIASQVALSVQNARLFAERERRLREVSAIKDIGSAITSTLDLQDVLERLHAELGRVIDVSTSFIALYDPTQNVLSYPIAFDQGIPVQFRPRPVGSDGVNHWVISRHQPLLIGTEAEYRSFYVEQPPYAERIGRPERPEESYAVVPIISGDEVLGVINIQSYRQHAYNQDDLRFVSTVANQAAIAINNARLFQERGRRIEELATFNEIGQQLSAVSRFNDLLEMIYRQTSRLLDTTNFYMALYDQRSGKVTFPLSYEHGQRVTESWDVGDSSLTAYVIQTRQPLLVQGPDWAAQVAARGIRPVGEWPKSWLGIPMIATDGVIGVIGIQDYEQETAYTQDDMRLLSTIASWAAIALHNAYLLNETHRCEVHEVSPEHLLNKRR